MSEGHDEDAHRASFDGKAVDELALSHAWSWFTLHAGQRLQSVYLFLVSFALVVAGYGASYQVKSYLISSIVAVAGLIISLAFWGLEERNRTLVKIGEQPLAALQRRLAQQVNLPSLEMMVAADGEDPGWRRFLRYSWVIRTVMATAMAWMIVGLLAAVIAAHK